MLRLTTLFVFLPLFLLAEGTKQLRPNETDYGFLNLMDKQNNLGTERTFALYNSPEETKLNIRIKDPANETITIGFKTKSTDPLFYRIISPDGSIFKTEAAVPMDNSTEGYINDYAEAIAGPNTLNANGYTPIIINPTTVGDYSIEFYDPTHNPSSDDYAQRQFELFDISVINNLTSTTIDGRLWSKAWDITTSSSSNPFDGSAFIYTNDGITTEVEFEAFAAWSFIIQSNSTGPGNSGDVIENRKSINGGRLLPDYKIFLTEPDATEFPISAVPTISGVPSIDLCTATNDYCIDLELSNPGVVEYIIDIDGGVGYDDPRDLKLTIEAVTGLNCLPWDGNDGLGNPVTTADTFDILLSYQAGVTHLFIHDAENNPNGFKVKHKTPATGLGDPLLYFDDSDPAVNGSVDYTGCASNCHTWSGGFGDNKTINTWWVTFFENDTIKDLTISNSNLKAAIDITVTNPLSCDGNNLQLAPLNPINEGAAPVYSWWINEDSITSALSFSPTSLNNGDNISLVLIPNEICTEPDTAIISIMVPRTPLIPNDTIVCKGDSITLVASSQNGFFRWLLDGIEISTDTTIKVLAEETKTYIAETSFLQPTANLIQNAGFEEGNIKFETEYTYRGDPPVLLGPGFYTIGTSGEDGFAGAFYDIPDHSGTGNMLIVDGNTIDGSIVYKSTVPVIAGIEYNLSAWVVNVHKTSANAPSLQFYINNEPLEEFDVSLDPVWKQYNTFWKAQITGNIELKIVNKVTAGGGNDFGLDDLLFGPINTCSDQVTVNVKEKLNAQVNIQNKSTVCEGDSVFYKAADTLNLGNAPTYEWYINGSLQIVTNDSISLLTPADNDSIILIATSSLTECINPIDKDTSVITVHQKPTLSISGNTNLCEGDTTKLRGIVQSTSAPFNYTWSTVSNANISTNTNILIQPAITTTYQLSVEDNNTCKDSISTTINITPKPILGLAGETICANDTATITSTVTDATGTISYNWSTQQGFISTTGITTETSPLSTTTYQLIINDANSCSDTSEITIKVNPNPIVNIIGEDVCNGSAANLNATITNGTPSFMYNWTPSTYLNNSNYPNVKATPITTTAYALFIEDKNGCKDSSSITVGVTDLPTASINQNDTLLCPNESVTLTAYTDIDYQFTWLYSSNSFEAYTVLNNGNSISTSNEGFYQLEVTNNGFCPVLSNPIQIRKEVLALNIVSSSLNSYNNEAITLSAEASANVTSFEWNPPVFNSTNPIITFIPENTATYTLKGKGEKCEISDTITITVFPPIIIPNGFSPNGDFQNEQWFIKGIDVYAEAEVKIYNRWGNEVYRYTNGYNTPWNGTNQNGDDLPIATYYYTIQLHDVNEQTFQGSISIVR